jgi:hypothetical protein
MMKQRKPMPHLTAIGGNNMSIHHLVHIALRLITLGASEADIEHLIQ